jgi:hypothetical protein
MTAPEGRAMKAAELVIESISSCLQASASGQAWPPRIVSGDGLDHAAFSMAMTQASRVLGKGPLQLSSAAASRLRAAGLDWVGCHWGVDDAGRVALLLLADQHLSESACASLIDECFRQGDSRERVAVLRALPLLPKPERFLKVAIESCRANVLPVFEAIACENPFPADHFPEQSFNQLVLKALFLEVKLERVLGLSKRLTPELWRMAEDYRRERAAAGRSIPPDLDRLRSMR